MIVTGRPPASEPEPAGSPPWRTETRIAMDTFVSITVQGAAGGAIDRAFDWFQQVEATCSRFDPASELSRLSRTVGEPVALTPLLFELLRFGCDLAAESVGAFDPAIGAALEARGFRRNYRTGQETPAGNTAGSYRDISLNAADRAVTLRRPLTLDVNAIAKGMAVDLAARELAAFPSGCISAGGDVFAWGSNDEGRPWQVGVQHPAAPDRLITSASLTFGAACTSGSYERLSPAGESHLVRPPGAPDDLASVTVFAPSALVADGLATAAYVLGFRSGRALLEAQGVSAIFVTKPDLAVHRLTQPGEPLL